MANKETYVGIRSFVAGSSVYHIAQGGTGGESEHCHIKRSRGLMRRLFINKWDSIAWVIYWDLGAFERKMAKVTHPNLRKDGHEVLVIRLWGGLASVHGKGRPRIALHDCVCTGPEESGEPKGFFRS